MSERFLVQCNRPAAAILAILAAALLASCAALDTRSPEEVVAERAQARWEALVAGNIQDAYQYYSPGYRSGVSAGALAGQVAGRQVQWKKANIHEVTCEEAVCRAVVFVDYQARSPLPRVGRLESSTRVEETWIESGGNWYYAPDA